jgi:hypothetical protein
MKIVAIIASAKRGPAPGRPRRHQTARATASTGSARMNSVWWCDSPSTDSAANASSARRCSPGVRAASSAASANHSPAASRLCSAKTSATSAIFQAGAQKAQASDAPAVAHTDKPDFRSAAASRPAAAAMHTAENTASRRAGSPNAKTRAQAPARSVYRGYPGGWATPPFQATAISSPLSPAGSVRCSVIAKTARAARATRSGDTVRKRPAACFGSKGRDHSGLRTSFGPGMRLPDIQPRPHPLDKRRLRRRALTII